MSRPLIALLFGLAMQAGCAVQPTPIEPSGIKIPVSPYPSIKQWLTLEQDVGAMESGQVEERLTQVDRLDGVSQLYYYGVLNQQLPTYGAWTLARDTFQKLQENEDLPREHRQLAGLLRKYNQSRINAYLRQQELQNQIAQAKLELQEAREGSQLLEQKIQALTELETVISTRKEE